MKKVRINGRGQTEYSWIFSLIIGAVIIFLAIYFATKYVGTSSLQTNAEISKELDILLNPFSSIGAITTLSMSKEVVMPVDIYANFTCNLKEDYENLVLKTDDKRSMPFERKIRNKYIFSEELKGKDYWIFSKSLNMPWRVDDMIYIVSGRYCFVDAPDHIQSEIMSMGNEQISLNCSSGSKKVCFATQNCDIYVDYNNGAIRKNRETLSFSGDSMMYAAIFSNNALYKCNVQRMMKRLAIQADMNIRKAENLGFEGCETTYIRTSLLALKDGAENGRLSNMEALSMEVKGDNPINCPIF